MPGIKLSSITRRLKHSALALLFVGTQIVFPLSLSGLASATSGASLQQCRNGSLASPDLCNDTSSNLGWVSGNAGSSDSHWREGDSLPYRMLFSGLSTTSTHSVTIQWDTLVSGKHALDYLTTYNRTATSANPCYGVTGCGTPSVYNIPSDSNVTSAGVTQIPGVFTLYNGVITSVTGYTLTTSNGGNASESITIDFTATDATPVLAWAGHIASQVDWGANNSASAISGSPYHSRLLDLDGSGGNQDRSLAAGAVLPSPTLTTQTSAATVNVGSTVTDTASLSGSGSPLDGSVAFYICGPSTTAPSCSSGTQVGTTKTVSPGTGTVGTATSDAYTVAAAGTYCFLSVYTPGSDAPYSPISETNQSTTAPNNECFVAHIAPSTITITKDAQPNSSQAFDYTTSGGLSTDTSGFSLVDSGSGTTNTKTFTNVAPGTYTITENPATGWDFKSLDCGNNASAVVSGTKVTITIVGGQSVSCTYTNAERGTLTVYKQTNPAGDTTSFPVTATTSNGNINGNASQNVSTTTPVTYDVSQGTYNVTEDLSKMPGWTLASNTCSNVVISAANLNATCTITNTKLAQLQIVKSTDPASSSQNFSFTATGSSITQSNNSFVLNTNSSDSIPNNYQYSNLTPGNYTVTEAATGGWQLTSLVCNGITYTWNNTTTLSLNLPAGANVSCTFTNTQLASISGTKYEVNADASNSIVTPLQNWTIQLLVNGKVSASTTTDANGNYSFSGLLPGSYSLAEVNQNGWTQIYPYNNSIALNLTAGNNATANNFGNFHNAQISGSKFNDQNGNGLWDSGEAGLQGWTMTLYDNGGSGAILNHQYAQTSTDASGNYRFTNLPPNTYKVCETMQSGWAQTYPGNNSCQIINVTLSGHNYSGTNFGNQGRGTITVIKNVDDGFGNVTSNVTNWSWNYSGSYGSSSNISSGSGNPQSVAAGNYTVSENQQSGYHVTDSICDNQSSSAVSTSKTVTVNPGDNITCTFTNTRDTGTIDITKSLIPSSDSGKFNLNINGTPHANNVGDGGTTGNVSVVTDTYSVSETAGSGTNMSDYSSAYNCTDNGTQVANGSGTSVSGLSVAYGHAVDCTFTNTRLASLTIIKEANPTGSQSFSFYFGSQVSGSNIGNAGSLVSDTQFSLYDNGTNTGNSKPFNDLNPGNYYVSEDGTSNWDLTNISCPGVTFTKDPNDSSKIYFTLAAGANVTCTYTNTERGSIRGTKTIVNSDGSTAISQNGVSGVKINLYQGSLTTGTPYETTTTDNRGDYNFSNLVPGDYSVTETVPGGYSHISGGGSFTISAGQDFTSNNTVDFGNFKNGSISGYKFNDLNGNGQYDSGEPKLSGWTIDIYTGASANPANLYDSAVTDASGNYSFINLPPNNYYVCEEGQSGWSQTYPGNPICYSIDINQSGEQDSAVFGNRGYGSITVIKNVNDGFGHITSDASGWSWNFSGTYLSDAGNPAGSTQTKSNLPADTYNVSENQQTNYHFTSVVCTDNGQTITVTQAETTSVKLNAGDSIVCTYTNTRDTGSVEVNKTLKPSQDSGRFDLHINGGAQGTSYTQAQQGDGGTTGTQTVVTGSYTVSETASPGTNMNDYSSTYECNNHVSGTGTVTPNFPVISGKAVVCAFTNTHLPTLLTISKFNNRPDPTTVGDIVTYTIVVSLPDNTQSSAAYDTTVTDLPPANFKYVTGSWTANSSIRGNLKAEDITSEPSYGSPGIWNLGNLVPGEVVTLTYQATIGSSVSNGSYPDMAYATAYSSPLATGSPNVTAGCVNSCLNNASGPFVATRVTVISTLPPGNYTAGQVLGAEVLVNTGTALSWLEFVLPPVLIGIVIGTRVRRQQKGEL